MTRLVRGHLIFAAIGIAVASLSVHVVMLQVMGVPYPDMRGIGPSGLILVAVRVFALVMVVRLAPAVFQALPIAARIAMIALLDTMLAGNIRSAIMEAVVTESLITPAAGLIGQLATSLVLALIVVVSRRLTRHILLMAVVALATTAAMTLLVSPFVASLEAPFAALARPEVHEAPYGLYVLSWSYAAFLETVVAVFAVAWATGGALSKRPTLAAIQFVLLVLALRGTLVMQGLFPWLMDTGFVASAVSTSQFFLQDLVMAVLTWGAWRRSFKGSGLAEPRGASRQEEPHMPASRGTD